MSIMARLGTGRMPDALTGKHSGAGSCSRSGRATRRALLIALGASAFTIPLSSLAQRQVRLRRIGYLAVADESTFLPLIATFKQAMHGLGYVEGKDYAMEIRSARGDVKRLPGLAAELVALGVDVIITPGTPNTIAARDATRAIPIVMVTTSDPVGTGLVASLARPGGNITGFDSFTREITTKRLELLRELVPSIRRVGFIHNPDSVAERAEWKVLAAGGEKLGVRVIAAGVPFGQDVSRIFAELKKEKADALIVASGANLTRRAAIIEQAYKNRLPAIYGNPAFVADGGLICYTADWPDQYRRAATYVDKIFKGARPADLPVEQPTRFELVLNMKTAKALGIKIPQSILIRTDKVIE